MGDGIKSLKGRHVIAVRGRLQSRAREHNAQTQLVIGGRYRLQKRAGEGLSSHVYLAWDMRTRRQVVVKQLSAEAAQDSTLTARFMREVHAIADIEHPNVVRIIDYGAPAYEQPYLVMEALAGETLSALLRRTQKLSRELSLFIATQAAQGLTAAHRQGTVHRDIKPENLYLVGPPGKPTCVKVIDFGMAKVADSRGSIADGRFVVGTLQYMPPEQVLADGVDARADVYSLGILLFRLLTGHLPFDVKTGLDMLSHQLLSPIPPLNWLCDDADHWLESIIIRATRKHPLNRYQLMAALLSDLQQLDIPEPERAGICTECSVEPDEYVPIGSRGKEIAAGLAQRFHAIPAASSPMAEPDSARPFELSRKR